MLCCAGDVLQDMGLRDAFNVQLSVPALNGDACATVLRSLDCFNGGEILQVRFCPDPKQSCLCSCTCPPAVSGMAAKTGRVWPKAMFDRVSQLVVCLLWVCSAAASTFFFFQ